MLSGPDLTNFSLILSFFLTNTSKMSALFSLDQYDVVKRVPYSVSTYAIQTTCIMAHCCCSLQLLYTFLVEQGSGCADGRGHKVIYLIGDNE